ncbi:hypothetical protein BV22DRAFT_1034425 [Leucogyrophana mollusca]|uniref:Uncharacterized protein n=1 Tax=Leucogyrophana mollusca TaxID=85980 RepID=A0ACB8BHX6_9AGAM|nr:hypothetical protein BV22DRAFT_1034425 [Leucogyrophana mollusca]
MAAVSLSERHEEDYGNRGSRRRRGRLTIWQSSDSRLYSSHYGWILLCSFALIHMLSWLFRHSYIFRWVLGVPAFYPIS